MKIFGSTALAVSASTAALAIASPAQAVTVLTFEGVGNFNPVGSYYAPNYVFSGATIALVDADAGGSGNFANEPSADTIMFFTDADNAILNVTNGFTTGFSFFYSSSTAAMVNVYSGLNGTGTLLGSISLGAQFYNGCSGDPTGGYCNWSNAGVAFAGTAYSIDFAGTADQTGFDNITFGSAVAGNVPEPSTWVMLLLGFGVLGSAMRRGKARQFSYA